jgi:hypothetical protein
MTPVKRHRVCGRRGRVGDAGGASSHRPSDSHRPRVSGSLLRTPLFPSRSAGRLRRSRSSFRDRGFRTAPLLLCGSSNAASKPRNRPGGALIGRQWFAGPVCRSRTCPAGTCAVTRIAVVAGSGLASLFCGMESVAAFCASVRKRIGENHRPRSVGAYACINGSPWEAWPPGHY